MKFLGIALFALGIYVRTLNALNVDVAIALVIFGALLISWESTEK